MESPKEWKGRKCVVSGRAGVADAYAVLKFAPGLFVCVRPSPDFPFQRGFPLAGVLGRSCPIAGVAVEIAVNSATAKLARAEPGEGSPGSAATSTALLRSVPVPPQTVHRPLLMGRGTERLPEPMTSVPCSLRERAQRRRRVGSAPTFPLLAMSTGRPRHHPAADQLPKIRFRIACARWPACDVPGRSTTVIRQPVSPSTTSRGMPRARRVSMN
jgi:hypothetical protein